MPPDDSERRRAVRRTPQPDEALSRVRLRTGRELSVVDISAHGTLLEGVTRLLPNTHTDIHIVTRNGRPVGELVPLRQRAFVASELVHAAFVGAPPVAHRRFRRDVDAFVNQTMTPRA